MIIYFFHPGRGFYITRESFEVEILSHKYYNVRHRLVLRGVLTHVIYV